MILAFFNEYDHNWKQARLDYLIVRTDGHAHRVHPHSNGREDHLLQLTALGWRQVNKAPGAGEQHVLVDTTHGRPTLGQAVANFEQTAYGQKFEPKCHENGMLDLPVKTPGDSGAPGPAVHISVPGLSVHISVPELAVHSGVPAGQSAAAQSHRPTPRLEPVPPEQLQSPPLPPGMQQRAPSSHPHVQKPAPPLPPQLQQTPPAHRPPLHSHEVEQELRQLQRRIQEIMQLRDQPDAEENREPAQQLSMQPHGGAQGPAVDSQQPIQLVGGAPQLSMQPLGGAQGPAVDSQQPIQPVGGATGHVDTSQLQTVSTHESMHLPSGAPEPVGGSWSSGGPGPAGGWQQWPQPEEQPGDAQTEAGRQQDWSKWQQSSDGWSGAGARWSG